MQPAGHDEVTRSLGRAADERRRFQLQEIARPQILAHLAHDLVAQLDEFTQTPAAQIQIAVAQADAFVHVRLGRDLEWRRLGLRQHRHGLHAKLNVARGQVGIGGALRPRANRSGHAEHEFRPRAAGGRVRFRRLVAVDHDLRDAVAVAQVDEDQPALVASTVHPAVERDGLAGVRESQFATCTRALGPRGAQRCGSFSGSHGAAVSGSWGALPRLARSAP